MTARGLSISADRPEQGTLLVDDVNLEVRACEAVGIIGESGSGKSLTVRSLVGLLPHGVQLTDGKVTFEGRDLTGASQSEVARLRGNKMGMVFQDAIGSLDPLFTVGNQLGEVIRAHRPLSRRAAAGEALELLESVGIKDPRQRMRAYPHELSGGMAQRVAIAIAIANSPSLLIADEATTALDVTIQKQVVDLIRDIQQRRGCAVLFVSHDLATVASLVDRVLVMYAGRVVESGPIEQVLYEPRHPYTAALVQSKPRLGDRRTIPVRLAGSVPLPGAWPSGCRFHPRCPIGQDRHLCASQPPAMTGTDTHLAACHFQDEVDAREVAS